MVVAVNDYLDAINTPDQKASTQSPAGSHPQLQKLLQIPLYALAFLAVLHWASVGQVMNGSLGPLWCGDFITVPLSILMNQLIPLAALCMAALLWQRIAARRRPLLPIAMLPLFLGTSATLILETFWLNREFELPTHPVWWFPWR
jgi:hypothetical protein